MSYRYEDYQQILISISKQHKVSYKKAMKMFLKTMLIEEKSIINGLNEALKILSQKPYC